MELKSLEKELKSLANKRRLKIISLVKAAGRLSAGNISERMKLSLSATSRHLSLLESAGVLEKEQISLEVYYFISRRPKPYLQSVVALC
jgi:DNA-binding transcriptional ArsR family regulator